MMVLVIAFHLKEELLLSHEKVDTKMIVLIMTVFLLAIVDIVGELLRWRKIEI